MTTTFVRYLLLFQFQNTVTTTIASINDSHCVITPPNRGKKVFLLIRLNDTRNGNESTGRNGCVQNGVVRTL